MSLYATVKIGAKYHLHDSSWLQETGEAPFLYVRHSAPCTNIFPSTCVKMSGSDLKATQPLYLEECISESVVRTKNNMGVMLESVGKFDRAFIEVVTMSSKVPMRILDLGVAYGYSTKELLKAGAIVTANDLFGEHLEVLWKSVSEDERSRLQLMPGNAVDLEFPDESFDGIMACRWFNYLTVDEVRKVLNNFYRWLVPGGRLCVTMESVHSPWYVAMYSKYVKTKEAGMGNDWPPLLYKKDIPRFKTNVNLPECVLYFDVDVLGRELKRAGFVVETTGYESRHLYPEETQRDGREGVGAIGVKLFQV